MRCGDLAAISVLGIIMLIITFAVVVGQPPAGFRRGTVAGTMSEHPKVAVAEQLADRIARARLPAAVRRNATICRRRDRAMRHRPQRGLCHATLAACDDDGPCTAIGHGRTLGAAGAALVNGTAAHGEDFDDTFEGGPVHAGAVVVPAVLAACERHNPEGAAALRGIAVGVEVLCRLSLVAPKAIHKAGFHPTAVFGAMGAAAGVAAALRLTESRPSTRSASRAAWRAASSSISPKAPGPSACMPAGRRNPACAPPCWPRRLLGPAHGVRGHARTVPRLRA